MADASIGQHMTPEVLQLDITVHLPNAAPRVSHSAVA